jgi:hypothetical protein
MTLTWDLLLSFGKVDDLFTLIRTAARTGAVGELGGFALGTYGNLLRYQKVVSTPHIFAGFGSFLLRHSHVDSPFFGDVTGTPPLFIETP